MEKQSDFIELQTEYHSVDLSVRQYKYRESPIIYLGRGSSVITWPLNELDDLIEFLKKARELELK